MKKILIVLLALLLCLGAAAAEEAGILGQPFPDFTATDCEGNPFILSEALKTHEAVLINIWTTWCPPCESEMAFLNEAYEQYGDRVAFIALSGEDNDTPEMIKAYRESHGISFPMGRDEGRALFQYMGGEGFPTTVIVDRFGNAAFIHVGCFYSTGEVTRSINAFLGDGYTETAVLAEIPKDTSTLAVPASAATAVKVENENVKPVVFRAEESPDPVSAYVVYDDTARLRLEAAVTDNPASLLCYDYLLNTIVELPDLLDPQRGAYIHEAPMPGAEADIHYNYVGLIDSVSGQYLADAYLIAGDEYIEELANDMRSWGYTITWEYAEPAPAESGAQAYILHVVDQDGAPVPGVTVNFCTDTACSPAESDENGIISFSGAPAVYHVQLIDVPDGYSYDEGFEIYTGSVYGEWVLRIRKD